MKLDKIEISESTSTRSLYSTRCDKCGQRISGFSESMVKYNMMIHKKQKHTYRGIEEVKK